MLTKLGQETLNHFYSQIIVRLGFTLGNDNRNLLDKSGRRRSGLFVVANPSRTTIETKDLRPRKGLHRDNSRRSPFQSDKRFQLAISQVSWASSRLAFRATTPASCSRTRRACRDAPPLTTTGLIASKRCSGARRQSRQ